MVKTVELTKAIVSNVIAWELEGNHRPSRENAVIAASQDLSNGTVISYNANGQVQIFGGATDEVAAGIFIGERIVTTSGQTAKGVVIARDARFVEGTLLFKSGLTNAKKTEALASLKALHITPVRAA
ncbi:head decoration protein [Acinetobacter dispersus]|uniref:head decoration protein n=1 Tax=Acinetobacter dispersus TaxID=70348 RepID=UPI001F4B26FD|nr:head decoration protein [Acinetobacter dispersus]MCH7395212.1 head decoration protein [Acinetobacter dispersus]